MRAALKRSLVDGYCHGRLPAWIVSELFWLFRLRKL